MQSWHIIHTKPHKERQVMYNLRQNQIEVYLPLVRVNPVNPRAARVRAFFPCYVFVKYDQDLAGIGLIQWTPGVRRLLEFGGQLAVVPENAVNEIKRRVAQISTAGGLVFDGLKHGDAVRIVGGPFAGYEAIFDSRLAGTERVRVLLEWVEQNQRRRNVTPRVIPVELNASNITKVKLRR